MANIKVGGVAGKISGPAGSVKKVGDVEIEVDTPEGLLKDTNKDVPVIIWCSEPYENPPVKAEERDCDGECGRRLLVSETSKHLAKRAAERKQEVKYLCAWCCKEVLEGLNK